MKKTLFLLLLFSMFYCYKSFSQKPDSTLKGTTDWLVEKLNGEVHSSDSGNISKWNTYIIFKNCTCTIKNELKETYKPDSIYRNSFTDVFNLKNISISSIYFKHYTNPPFYWIYLVTQNDLKLISHTDYNKGKSMENIVGIPVNVDANHNLENIKKAFSHAIKLCGGN